LIAKMNTKVIFDRFVFYASFILAGVGSSPLYTLTLTYIEENVKPYVSFCKGMLF